MRVGPADGLLGAIPKRKLASTLVLVPSRLSTLNLKVYVLPRLAVFNGIVTSLRVGTVFDIVTGTVGLPVSPSSISIEYPRIEHAPLLVGYTHLFCIEFESTVPNFGA